MKSTKSEIIKHIPNTNLNDQSMPSECLESLTTRDSPVNSPENLNDPDPVTTFLNDPFTTNGSVTMVSSINQSIKNESGKGENIPSNAEKLLNSLIQDVSMQKAVSILDQPVSSDNQEDLLLHRVNIDLIQHLNEVEDHEEVSDLSSPPSPGMLSPTSRADMYSTDNVLADTQMSLCKKSEDLHLHDMGTVDTSTLWSIVSNQEEEALHPPSPDDGVHKSLKLTEISDAHTSLSVMATVTQTIPDSVFDAEGAVSSAQFVFTKFGSDVPGVFSFSAGSNDTITSSVITPRPTANIVETSNKEVENKVQVKNETPEPLAHSTVDPDCEVSTTTQTKSVALQQPPVKHLKEPSLNLTFPAKSQGCELKILKQPEDQHRARYMTEGSRGAIKDKSQQGHPIVKLLGCKKPVTLQVFIGTDTGKVKPHGFYQACKVCGKNSTQCSERDIEGTTVIELQLDPQDEMTVNIDCVGILKLRNADVEQRIGLARSKKKSTRARMVFRVNIPKADGSHHTLQVASMPISCTQPAGQPEICKKSLEKCSAEGGEELFIIGKNFTKGTKVVFEEKDDPTLWSAEGSIDMEYFQPGHLICKIPAYQDEGIAKPVEVQITVQASGRISEPHKFFYLPASHSGATDSTEEHAACSEPTTMTHVKEEVAMETDETMAPPSQSETPAPSMPVAAKTYVSPVALALNKMYEQAAQTSSSAPSVLSMNGNVCLTSQENGMDNMDDITHPTWATTQVPMQQDTLVAPELPPLQIQPQHQHCKIMKIDTESQSQMGQLVQSESSPGGSFGQIETSTTQMNSPQTASPEPVQQFSQQTTQVSSDSFQSQQFTSPAQPVTVQMLSSPQQLASPADQFNNLQAKIQVEADEQLQSQPSTCFTFQQVAPQAAQQVGQITPHIVSPEPVQQEVDRTQQGIQQVESQQQTFQQVGACQQQLAPQQQQQHEVQVVTQKLNLDLQQQTPELQAVLQQLINQRKQQLQPAAAATQPVQQATLLQNFMETDSVPQQQVFTNISQLNPQILQLNTQQQNVNPEPVQMTLPLASQKPLVSQVMNQAGQVLSQSKEVLPPQPTMFNIQVQNSQPSNAQAQISQQINAPPAQAQEGNSARNTVQQLLNSLQTSQMAPCQAQSQPTTVLQLLQQQSSAQQQVQQAQVQQTQVQQAQVQQTQVQQAQVQQAQVQQTQVQQAQVQQAQVQQAQVQQTQVQQTQVQQAQVQQVVQQQQAVQQQAVQQQQQAQVTQVQLAQAPPASNQQQAANQLVQQLQQILQQQKQPVTVVFAGHNSLPLNTALLTNTQLPQTTHTFSEGAQQPLLQQPNLANLVTPQQPVGGTTSLHQLLQQQVGGTTVLMTQPSTQSSAQNASTSIDTSSQRAMKRDVKGQPVSSPEVGRSPASELYTLLTSAAPSTTTNMPVMSRESNTSTPAMATSPITSANQVDTSHPSPVVTVNKQMPAASPKQEQPATSQQKWMETNQDTMAVGNTQPANPTGRSGLAEGGFPNIAVEDVDRLLNPGQMRSQMQ